MSWINIYGIADIAVAITPCECQSTARTVSTAASQTIRWLPNYKAGLTNYTPKHLQTIRRLPK